MSPRKAGSRDGWTRVRFGDVVENVNDQPKRSTLPLDTRYIAGEHVDEDRLTIDRWGTLGDDLVPPTFKRRFQPGDVLFHSRNLKKIAVPTFGGITGEKLFVLRSKSPDLLQEFVPSVLLSPAFAAYVEASWSGSVNKFLNWTPLAKYEFDLPPFAEQISVARITRLTAEWIEAARIAAQESHSLFLAALRDLLPLKDHDAYMALLGDLYRVGTGGTPSRSRTDYWGGNIPWVKTGEVNYRTIRDTEEGITPAGLANSAAKVYPSGSIVMALFGQGPTLGRVARLGIDASTNQACAVIQSDDADALELLFYWLWRQYKDIRTLARGATQPNLNVAIVKSLLVPTARGESLRRTLQVLQALEDSATQTNAYLRKVETESRRLAVQLLANPGT